MSRIFYFAAFVLALGTGGCGGVNNQQQAKTTSTTVSEALPPPPPPLGQPKPDPSPSELPAMPEKKPEPPDRVIPAPDKPSPLGGRRVRHVATPSAVQGAEDSQSYKLANEILKLSLAERLEWTTQEFAKRGIADVHNDK